MLPFYRLSSNSTSVDDLEYLVRVDSPFSNSNASLREFSEALPVVEAETYHYGELPYHAPPEIWKISHDANEKITLYQRKKTWDGEFLEYYNKTKTYPSLKYERKKEIDIKTIFTKDNDFLDKDLLYLWVVDAKCRFIFCPEKQINCSINRNVVKHGDMVVTGQFIGTVNNIVSGRGPARLGGEFQFDKKKQQWKLNNDSSYCFFRTDKQIISNGRGFKWQNLIDNLFRAYEIDRKELLYIDMVQSRRLDGYFIQSTAFNFQRHRNRTKKNQALEHMIGDSHGLLTLFKDVDFSDFLLSSFGADVYLLTEGVANVQIIRGDNIPGKSLLSYPERYCKVYMKGCEYGVKRKWWHQPQKTKAIKSKSGEPIYWNSEPFEMYVTTRLLEVIVIDIYQSPSHKLGSVFIDMDKLEEGVQTTEWYPVLNSSNPKARLGVSVLYKSHVKRRLDHSNQTPSKSLLESTMHSSLAQATTVEYFSTEVWMMILSWLTKYDVIRLTGVSRKFRDLVKALMQGEPIPSSPLVSNNSPSIKRYSVQSIPTSPLSSQDDDKGPLPIF